MRSLVFLLTVSFILFKITHAAKMVYEFGVDEGQVIYSRDGTIPLLNYETIIDIPVPDQMMISYIKVVVDSLSPPKVDYMSEFKQITIKYTWVQVTASTYNIIVKGTPL